MKLMNERNQVRGIAKRWRAQYGAYKDWKQEVTRKLDAIDDETATAADVAAIIGNETWAEPRTCHECGEASWDVVQVGEEPDYESATALVCVHCLRKAIALVTGEKT
jgi:hypothetical protein